MDASFPGELDYHSGFANIDETEYNDRVGPHYLRRITAVGIYPLGRQPELDLYDLSGNVAEWCLTLLERGRLSAPTTMRRRVATACRAAATTTTAPGSRAPPRAPGATPIPTISTIPVAASAWSSVPRSETTLQLEPSRRRGAGPGVFLAIE